MRIVLFKNLKYEKLEKISLMTKRGLHIGNELKSDTKEKKLYLNKDVKTKKQLKMKM